MVVFFVGKQIVNWREILLLTRSRAKWNILFS